MKTPGGTPEEQIGEHSLRVVTVEDGPPERKASDDQSAGAEQKDAA